jgi:hypothetical protein
MADDTPVAPDPITDDTPQRMQVLDAEGNVVNTILASVNFCNEWLVLPDGGSWRVEPAPPVEAAPETDLAPAAAA